MSDLLAVSTRKGLFWVERKRDGWRIAAADFLGDNVTLALRDPRNGADYAVLNHGHFGVKLHRRARGVWEEAAAPAYPPKPEGLIDRDGWGKDIPYTLINIFALEPGGAGEAGLLWCGTIPGGLFRSRDDGATWQLIRSLWDHPDRQQWMGGGTDWPAIHSICVDPRDSRTVRIAISCGGVWETRDGGETWTCRADGMFAAYLPPDMGRDPNTQDPHRLVQSPANRTGFGSSIITAFSAATTVRRHGSRSSALSLPHSASPSLSIPANRTRPGSSRQSRTSAAFPSRARSWSLAPATPAGPSMSCAAAFRKATPTMSSIATPSPSTTAAIASPSPPRRADFM